MWYNPFVTWILRSPLHGLMSGNTLLLTYTGRKSRQSFTFPISYARQDDTFLLITHRRKTWWKNIQGGLPVTLRVRGQEIQGNAEVADINHDDLADAMQTVYRGMPRRLAEQHVPESLLVRVRLASAPKS